jgi:hypothetical protein
MAAEQKNVAKPDWCVQVLVPGSAESTSSVDWNLGSFFRWTRGVRDRSERIASRWAVGGVLRPRPLELLARPEGSSRARREAYGPGRAARVE